MPTPFWQQDKKQIAEALLGQPIVVGNLEVVILDTEGFTKKQNSTGVYKPLLEMPPGQIYCPSSNSHVILLISALDKGEQGGCVLVKAIELHGQVIRGPGNVAKALGITQINARGSVSMMGERMVFGLSMIADPQVVKGTPAVTTSGIGAETLKKHMPKFVGKFMRDNPQKAFEVWVNELVADCANEAELAKKLKK